jgi:hypothetical protein
VADEVMGELFPLDYPEGETGWRVAHYTDLRPGVGVLSTNSMWWFKGSMENNRNRGRANYLSKLFLCDDYLEREVPFVSSENLSSEELLGDAIQTNPGCVACHQTLDPLASHFYGWWWYFHDKGSPYQFREYHPERETLWRELTGVAPGFFGQPSSGLVDLGTLVSNDPRYASCLVKNTWELSTRTDVDLVEVDLGPVQEAFEASGLRVRSVFEEMARHPAYQGYDARFAVKMATPSLLAAEVRGLTGYSWLMDSNDGYVLLAGGVDGDRVLAPSPTGTVTTALVQERLAENAARFVVVGDAPKGDDRVLFSPGVDLALAPDPGGPDVVRDEIVHLVRRVFGRRIDAESAEADEWRALWSDLHALSGDPTEAWVGLVSAMLRDPDLVMY